MSSFRDFVKANHTAVVTGASSGIGKAACIHFAKAGMQVWMIDIDSDELQQAHQQVQQLAEVHMRVVDVANANQVQELAAAIPGPVHILMNNAGTGRGGGPRASLDELQHTMNVNTYGPIHGCQAFLPKIKEGIIVNVGSKQGITMPPGNLAYNMSKAALKCFTEGFEHELMKERKEGKHNVRAVLLVPGWVNTNILYKAEAHAAALKGESLKPTDVFFSQDKPHEGAWMPQQIVEFMIQEADAGKFYIICPDNDVDRETDNLRMTWTMQDITQDRQPLSRWHPDYKDQFAEFLKANGK